MLAHEVKIRREAKNYKSELASGAEQKAGPGAARGPRPSLTGPARVWAGPGRVARPELRRKTVIYTSTGSGPGAGPRRGAKLSESFRADPSRSEASGH